MHWCQSNNVQANFIPRWFVKVVLGFPRFVFLSLSEASIGENMTTWVFLISRVLMMKLEIFDTAKEEISELVVSAGNQTYICHPIELRIKCIFCMWSRWSERDIYIDVLTIWDIWQHEWHDPLQMYLWNNNYDHIPEMSLLYKMGIASWYHTLCKGGGQDRRKAGSGATEQGTDQQGRSGNGEAMNKLWTSSSYKQGKQVES